VSVTNIAHFRARTNNNPSTDRFRSITDFKIECGIRSWDVHRFVLFLHSDVLAAACSRNFKEATTGTVDLSDDNPDSVDALVQYCYKLDYGLPQLSLISNEFLFHLQVCIVADKYDIAPLQTLATHKFRHLCTTTKIYLQHFAEVAALAYEFSEPAKDVRAIIVETAIEQNLIAEETLDEEGANPFVDFMRSCGDLAIDVAVALASKPRYESASVAGSEVSSNDFYAMLEGGRNSFDVPTSNTTYSWGGRGNFTSASTNLYPSGTTSGIRRPIPDDSGDRRRAQNRLAQRRFRDKRDARAREAMHGARTTLLGPTGPPSRCLLPEAQNSVSR
jgi:hypothetical protein